MKALKKIFKPLVVVYVFAGVGCIAVLKHTIMFFKIKSQYKAIVKLNAAKRKLYSLVFNPYRISNGFRPACMQVQPLTLSELERCHQIIQQEKQHA